MTQFIGCLHQSIGGRTKSGALQHSKSGKEHNKLEMLGTGFVQGCCVKKNVKIYLLGL